MSPDPYSGSYDPTNPQSLNRYSYAMNNPLSFIDPSGLQDMLDCDDDGNCTVYDDGNDGGDPCASDFQACVSGDPPPDPGDPCDSYDCSVGSDPYAPRSGGGGGGQGPAPNKSTICTPVFCPANDTPPAPQPNPKETACRAQAQAAESKFAKNPGTFMVGAGASRIQSTLQNSRLPGGSALSPLKWLGALEALYVTWAGNDAMNQAFYDSAYRDCMAQ